ncbi:MAG: FMN-binding negative transcriptional regulator [Rhodobacter sp.]|uniref:FMN-binding negative transcriptional regulator n=1 Tax=Pararhodobacter sp. TaxID=2127056 RepID=UPI001E102BC7|nr:FMN-binding negative transcriptional regulator [Pararhodobacter sp.]MCB1409299.1 FMN-binding negative transcriptional regulator [Paracoccaceae bacterium]MCC0074205.1 FMN-binding negative transcriptional regulator [Rhodobacter sp.]HPD93273.1 FMN-binding negative transcriptional regulator [Pararhodobacter sp.]
MYTPDHFTESDAARIDQVIHDHPLAALVAMGPQGLVANHLPLLRDGDGFVGHVALANDLHRDLPDGAAVLAIFRGAEGYVSPNWYPSKAETHRAVPTWNYQVVHVHARIRWSHAERDRRRAVSLLTARHEAATQGAAAWRMGDAPADFLAQHLARIVAFRLEVTRVEAKSKLNQNRDARDIAAVAERFEAQGKDGLARAMRGTPDPRSDVTPMT